MLSVAPMENPADYQYDIDTVEVAGFGVVVAWLVVGYSILPLMFYGMIQNLASSMGEYQTLVRSLDSSRCCGSWCTHTCYLCRTI